MVSHEGPREDELAHFKMRTTLKATGWESKSSQKLKALSLTLKCSDPGYNMTSIILAMAGITLVQQHASLPGKGGVFTPGALFYKTNIMEDLKKQGLEIELPSEIVEWKTKWEKIWFPADRRQFDLFSLLIQAIQVPYFIMYV